MARPDVGLPLNWRVLLHAPKQVVGQTEFLEQVQMQLGYHEQACAYHHVCRKEAFLKCKELHLLANRLLELR